MRNIYGSGILEKITSFERHPIQKRERRNMKGSIGQYLQRWCAHPPSQLLINQPTRLETTISERVWKRNEEERKEKTKTTNT
jgi:hypothetical protein